MTIQFNCPNCDAVIGFDNKHCGKHARCTTCGQRFIIPSKEHEKAEKVEPPKEIFEPIPGFYRVMFVESWKLFIRPANVTGLVFVTAAVCFKFFAGHLDYSWTAGGFRFQAPLGLEISLAAWGCMFWYYLEIIVSTAVGVDELPDVGMGGFFGFIWNIIKSLFMFAFALIAVELPCIIFIIIEKNTGLEAPTIRQILCLAGLFVFPAAILVLAVVRDISILLRLDYLLKPVLKAFCPYMFVFILFATAWQLQLLTIEYGQLSGGDKFAAGLHLCANLGVQVLAIISMRSIGLFYRHYACHFAW